MIAEANRTADQKLCEDCPPVDYPTDDTRCLECPRRTEKCCIADCTASAATINGSRWCLYHTPNKSGALFDSAGISNENDEWYTPLWMFRALSTEFDLDPCSPGVPPSNVPAKRHMTKADNGLTAEWHGSVWLNPPFSGKRPWYERLVQHGNGIALMPARTETHDFQAYMNAATALLFLRGRIYFERGHRPGANGNGAVTTPPFGIVLCAYGPEMADALMASDLMGVRANVWTV